MPTNELDSPARTSRRRFLRTAAGAAAASGALAAGANPAAAQEFGGWFDDVPNYDGEVTDATGESQVTVEVGVDTDQGPYGFGPPAVRVDPGTEITFTWVSDTHNVIPEEQPQGAGWEGHETIENDGFEFSSTLETEGVYLYFCDPHRTLGMKAAIVVGDADVGGGGGDGGGEGEEGGLLSPGMLTLGGALLLAALSPVIFGLYLLRRRGESPPDGDERVADGRGPLGHERPQDARGGGE